MVDTSVIADAAWFGIPLPMQFKLEFHLSAILSFAALFVTSGLETIGNTSGITIAGFDREATEKKLPVQSWQMHLVPQLLLYLTHFQIQHSDRTPELSP